MKTKKIESTKRATNYYKLHLPILLLVTLFILLSSTQSIAQNKQHKGKGNYASLAIDRINGERYGWAVNYKSQDEADRRALKECKRKGGNGHIVLRFKGGCGVFVVDKRNPGLYGWGTADTHEKAKNRAMDEARARGGKNLKVRVWGCNSSDLVYSKDVQPSIKGVYYFYFTKSSKDKKCFITDVLYQPNVAKKNNDSWVWTSDAKQKMKRRATKFLDAVEDNLYGYLGELKKKVIKRISLDWKGANELDINNKAINLPNSDRKKKLGKAITAIRKSFKKDGYKIFNINVLSYPQRYTIFNKKN